MDRARRPQFIEMDDLRLSETAYLNVPERDKSPSPADSIASSVSDLSTLPIHGRHRETSGVSERNVRRVAARTAHHFRLRAVRATTAHFYVTTCHTPSIYYRCLSTCDCMRSQVFRCGRLLARNVDDLLLYV